MALIEARGLTKTYRAAEGLRAALADVSLVVEEGELLSVLGPSGSGKSTLLGILGGLDTKFEGRLSLFGRDVRALSDRDIARLRSESVGFVFQAFHLLPHLTVIENVLAPTLFSRSHGAADARRRGLELLDRLGLASRVSDKPASLSGGQRQRVAVARALMMKPRLLLCDEPTGNLDAETGAATIELLRELWNGGEITIVAVTHEERLAQIGTRRVAMRDGRLESA